jgi:hypothetical protein
MYKHPNQPTQLSTVDRLKTLMKETQHIRALGLPRCHRCTTSTATSGDCRQELPDGTWHVQQSPVQALCLIQHHALYTHQLCKADIKANVK